MALRRNKSTGGWERQQPDGTWLEVAGPSAAPPVGVAAPVADSLDAALDEAFDAALDEAFEASQKPTEPVSANGSQDSAEPAPAASVSEPSPTLEAAVVEGQFTEVPSDGAQVVEGAADAGLDFDIPGLTSSDGSKGTRGAAGVRDRLMARRGTGGRSTVSGARSGTGEGTVVVAERAARASGPAVRDGTEARGRRGRSGAPSRPSTVGSGTASGGAAKAARYTAKPAPGILSSSPKWVQDLFEAHFRSDMTLRLRRENNRMKISRQDYAIGWLTLLAKVKEDPSILRLKDKG
jgi:hypothetical protein